MVLSVCKPQLVCEAQASLSLAENVPELHSTQLLSAVVDPVVQKDPSAQESASAFDQFVQASLLLAENDPELHSMQLLSAVVEPVVQTEPSAQEAALAFVQLAQSSVADPA